MLVFRPNDRLQGAALRAAAELGRWASKNDPGGLEGENW